MIIKRGQKNLGFRAMVKITRNPEIAVKIICHDIIIY